ncbi:profilin [Dendrothele bispora CBS 962.96]|uniref:Profilin n=1 Tax=Dendrothele bispora (strain CBS 962.96) TaxID=1314807 RepID=A0A4S8MJS3_DENBC|nr:profilin [Dendrothele bispora CBS 962.96]
MSWQAYVDTNLVGSGKIARAAILGQQGGVWAVSAGYNLSTEEQSAILKAFSNPEGVQASGLRLAGKKFFTLQVDGEHIYLKQAANGAVIRKTKQAVLVGEYDAPTQAPEATPVVEGLGDYLVGVGY